MDNTTNDDHHSTEQIKQSQYSERHRQSILSAIDIQLDKDKNEFVKRMSFQAEMQEEIERLAQELKGDIKNLSNLIKKILHKHHTDYIMTFSAFMETVRKDLRKKIEQIEHIEEEKKNVNDLQVLKCEKEFFRSYSIKLSNINKELTSKIDDMNLKMKILSEEVNSLTLKWQNAEKENKQLVIELEASILKNKSLKTDIANLKSNKDRDRDNSMNLQPLLNYRPRIHIEDTNCINNSNSNNSIGESYGIQKRAIDLIEKLKGKLKRERNFNQRSSREIHNMALEKNRLENLFIDCVEETRKNVWKRRVRDTFTSHRNINNSQNNDNDNTIPKLFLNSNSSFESFLPIDKREILESFIFNNEVWTVIRDALFSRKSMDSSQQHQLKPSRLFFEKINLKNYRRKSKECQGQSIEEKISFFNPNKKEDDLVNENTKKKMYDFLKRAKSQNFLLPIKIIN